ncbi:MAG: glutathione S-transferase N-terminal domain-containing protein [Paraglaciecola sp.]|uniref:glutathione S-transferase N-terminal domain-containing protein n=1 Tax=Paraglaciecola sp. TaxID=1920173 RepID=UPI003297D4AF
MKYLKIRPINFASSLLVSLARTGTGISSNAAAIKPEICLMLFDIEGCPYCRLVREALTELDLDAEIYPCPKSGTRYRPLVLETGGKAQFPFLSDPNTGVQIYESLGIIEYLFETYGKRALPLKWQFGKLQKLSSMAANTVRLGVGQTKKASRAPEQLLELYSFEASPYARIVRECLCELEIPYILRSCGRTELGEWLLPPIRDALNIKPSSALTNRKHLQSTEGKMAIPYLVDPNNSVAMFDSTKIVEYLRVTYGNNL